MSFRPPSRSRRPPSGMRTSSGYRPTTGFRRLDTANGQLPMSGKTVGLDTNVVVTNRPITQHGLSGMNVKVFSSKNKSTLRKVADRNYYENELKLKLKAIKCEIANMNQKMNAANKNKIAIKNVRQTSEKLIVEVRDFEGQLADYNLALDKWRSISISNTNTDSVDGILINLSENIKEIEKRNNNEKLRIDSMFLENKNLKSNVFPKLQTELNMIYRKIEDKLSNNEMIVEYQTLQKEWQTMLELIAEKEKNLSDIQHKYHQIRNTHFVNNHDNKSSNNNTNDNNNNNNNNTYANNFKFIDLQKKIQNLTQIKQELQQQTNDSMNPEKIKQTLLTKVKTDNKILQETKEAIANTEERIEELNNLLTQKERDLSTMKEFIANAHKYEQLFDRDRKMQEFIDNYKINVKTMQKEMAQHMNDNQRLLIHMSEDIIHNHNEGGADGAEADDDRGAQQQPAANGSRGRNKKKQKMSKYQEMKHNLNFKHKQKEIAHNTKVFTEQQLQKTKLELEKIEILDKKIGIELENIDQKELQMSEEMNAFKTNHELKVEHKRNKTILLKKKQKYMKLKEKTEQLLLTMAKKLDKMNLELNNNEYQQQLQEMEQKIQKLSQNIFTVEDSIAEQKRVSNYHPIKNQILSATVVNINQLLIQEIEMEG